MHPLFMVARLHSRFVVLSVPHRLRPSTIAAMMALLVSRFPPRRQMLYVHTTRLLLMMPLRLLMVT